MALTSTYNIDVIWTGNTGEGTKNTGAFEQTHVIRSGRKQEIFGGAATDKMNWNPEECLIASISSCHMLWYLHLCARNDITAIEYFDSPVGKLELEGSNGKFVHVELKPKIKIQDKAKLEQAKELHNVAHKYCYISNSVNFPVHINPEINIES